jgi:5-methylcytosine-specific restriction protein B
MGERLITNCCNQSLAKQLPQKATHIHETLLQFFKELRKLGAEFGYRSATEMLHLLYQLGTINSALTLNEQLDIAIMQKLLPKLHGSRRKLCPVLIALGKLCVDNHKNVDKISPIEKDIFEVEDYDYNQQHVLYPLSLEKIVRMYKGAIDNGFASFAEA